jgi:hypothetical protein
MHKSIGLRPSIEYPRIRISQRYIAPARTKIVKTSFSEVKALKWRDLSAPKPHKLTHASVEHQGRASW